MVRKLISAATAAAIVAAPLAAQAAPARDGSPVSGDKEQLVGLLWQYVVLPVIVAAVLALVLGEDEDEEPASP